MRYWELDAARGLAVTLMITYHIIFDIYFPSGNPFKLMAFVAASGFILISGMSLSISYSKSQNFVKFAKRGVKLLLLAGIVTVASFLLFEEGAILFGVLHFFGVTSFLIYPFLKYSKSDIILLLSIVVIIMGLIFLSISIDFDYLLWLGLKSESFYTLDFFPIFPWFGLLLLGMHMGSVLYPNGKRAFNISENRTRFARLFQWLGRNSLAVYMIHQPIILSILYVLGVGVFA